MDKEKISEIYSVLKANQEKLLEISGVDVKRLLAIQKETAYDMAKIAKRFGDGFEKAAPGIAERHRKAMVSHYKLKPHPYPWPPCPSLDQAVDCVKSQVLAPADDPAHAKGDATCDVPENICRPYLELHGMGTGVPVSGTVTCGLVFSYKDVDPGGDYTIKAYTQANGYHLLQIWSCGPCASPTPSSGHLKITVRVTVAQLFEETWSEYVILDTTAAGPPAAVDLNRTFSHLTSLRKGFDADIKIEFKIDASIDGCAQCFVDLFTSEFFYFKVVEVEVCRWPPFTWPPLAPLAPSYPLGSCA